MSQRCVKCGGTEVSGPRYTVDPATRHEWLEYACKRCGYRWRVDTLDARDSNSSTPTVDWSATLVDAVAEFDADEGSHA